MLNFGTISTIVQSSSICARGPTLKTLHWKADVLLLHWCEILQVWTNSKAWCSSHSCPHSLHVGLLQGSEQTQKLAGHFHVLHKCKLLLGAHPVRCTGLNKLNAGDASVILAHQPVRIPLETGQLIFWDVTTFQTKWGQVQNMWTLLHKKTPNRKQVLAKEKYAYTKDDAKKCVRQTQSPKIKLKATDLCTDREKITDKSKMEQT